MAKRVYFAFHYQDVVDFRANVVRNHWLTKKDREDAGFFDASIWEEARKKGDLSLKRLINGGLENTTVTVVLIGSFTYERRWVRYEIMKSMERGNNIIGIHINGINGKDGKSKDLGPNPFKYLTYEYSDDGSKLYLYEWANTKWISYSDLESYKLKTVTSKSNWNKSYQLSKLYKVYKWNADDGYNNFSDWI
jgi:hypothetical protein